MEELKIGERDGMILLSVPVANPFTGQEVSVPFMSFPTIVSLKNHIIFLQDYLDKHTTKIPRCIEDAFRES